MSEHDPLRNVPSESDLDQDLTWGSMALSLRHLWERLGNVATDRRLMLQALAAILLLAGILRFTGLDWDNHQHLHPDERFLTMVENSLTWPKSLGEYFDTSVNPLNPYNHDFGTYVYGLAPVVLTKFVGQVTGLTGYDGVYLAGRALSGIMDMGCIVLVFLLGRRLYNAWVGLVGALLAALSVLSIQQSHYFTVDSATTLFVTLALYYAVRVAQGEGWGSVLMLAVSFGLAVSAKISVLSFLLVIGLAYLLRVVMRWQGELRREQVQGPQAVVNWQGQLGRLLMSFRIETRHDAEGGNAPEAPFSHTERLLFQALRGALSLLLVVVVAFWVFRIVQPQAFTGPGFFNLSLNPKWKQDMSYIQQLMSGQIDYPPSHQWTARPPVWYSLKNMVLWGLGLPLGLAVWASWAFMAYELIKKHRWLHLLPWAWMTFTFFYQSIQFVKTIRYMLPIYPTMALMAGYGLISLWEWAKRARAMGIQPGARPAVPLQSRIGAWAQPIALGLTLVVILGTAFWAFAFVSIYIRPVTRITASRWIYQNLPKGSTVSFEQWDDPIPLNLDGHIAGVEYPGVEMQPYWEDIPDKRAALYQWLDQADYIALTSNRLWASIPRLWMRYPMTTRYYQALFSGELGYDRVVTFTSRPRFLGIEINDDDADESFTVYDHPKVIIFKKRADFSLDQAHALFDGYDLDRIVHVMPRQVTSVPNGLMLTADNWLLQRVGGTWSHIFNRYDWANQVPVLVWLLILVLLGGVAFPIGFVAFRRLRDRGYILGKTLAILLLGYLSWLLASLKWLPYTRGTILGVLLLLLLVSAGVAWVQRRALAEYVRARWRLLLVNELLFLLFFLVFLLIRRGNPDLWHPVTGGEKPMDLAYLNAIIKSSYFPPYDPWFAGGYINYYYYGLVMMATLIKLTGIVPTVAYNLAIPTCFALTAMGASCVVFNLIPAGKDEEVAGASPGNPWLPRALRYGLVGALLVAVVGNLGELQLLVNGLTELGQNVDLKSSIPGLVPLVKILTGLGLVIFKGIQLPFRPEWWYWNASRIMPHGEINEFPFFTFLYADLHAHLTAMPFALLALGLATSLVVTPVAALSRLARDMVSRRQAGEGPDEAAEEAAPVAEVPPADAVAVPPEAAAFPLRVTVLSWKESLIAWWHRFDWAMGLQLSLLALVVGELWCNNSWDYPTYLLVALVALAFSLYGERKRIDERGIIAFVVRAAYVIVLSLLFFRPYHANYGAAYTSVEPWTGDRTPLGAYLLIHLTPLFILASYLLVLAFERGARNGPVRAIRLYLRYWGRRKRVRRLYGALVYAQTVGYDLGWIGLVALGILLLAFASLKAWILFLAVPLLVLACALTLARRASPERRLQTFLVALGIALTIAVEYVVLKGDVGRMNTVFKFYLQVWIIWGVVAAVALSHLLRRVSAWPQGWSRLWRGTLSVLLISIALYPMYATLGKVNDRWDSQLPPGLDGMQYMTTAHYNDNNSDITLEYDRRAIVWLQDHVLGSPVIAEANTPLYRWGSRISIYTGLPTIVGWDWHEKQQRAAYSGDVVEWRLQDLRDLYNTTDTALAIRILERYQVGYVYVGELERSYYDVNGLDKFERMVGTTLDVAYRDGPVTIYRVRGSGAQEVAALDSVPLAQRISQLWTWISRHWVGGVVRAEGPQDPAAPTAVPKGATLLLDGSVDRLPVLQDRGWNTLARVGTLPAIFCWWLVLEVIGLAAWPLVARVFAPYADRGYGLAKGIGLLLVSYGVWLSASLRLVANSPPLAWGALIALGGCSFFLWSRRRHDPLGRSGWRLILIEEGLFTVAFLAFVGLRILNPDLWQPWFGGEKMMEIAILNALTRSAYMPPYDPYFAGGYLNYYYYGQFVVAVLIKLTGIIPEVAFNLAVPTVFALTVAHGFWVGYHLGARLVHSVSPAPADAGPDAPRVSVAGLWSGGCAVVMVALAANLNGVVQLLEGLARVGGASFAGNTVSWADVQHILPGLGQVLTGSGQLPPFDYWYQATRIIPNTINEFPFFSFLFADLHPHMIGIPFTVVVIALGLALVLDEQHHFGRLALHGVLAAIVVGALGPMNTWDLPTYLGLLGCAMLYRGYKLGRARGLLIAVGSFALLALFSLALYTPFYLHYQVQNVGLAPVPSEEHSPLPEFMVIWGPLLLLALSWIVLNWKMLLRTSTVPDSAPTPGPTALDKSARANSLQAPAAAWYTPLSSPVMLGATDAGIGAPTPPSALGEPASNAPTDFLFRDAPRDTVSDPQGTALPAASEPSFAGPAEKLMTMLQERRNRVMQFLRLALLVVALWCGVLLALKGMVVAGVLVPLIVAGGALLLVRSEGAASGEGAAFWQRLLLLAGLAILLGVELFYLQDFLAGGEWRRMNTVFKFYIQAWVLLGLACGSALPMLWRALSRSRNLASRLWQGMLGLFLFAALLYPFEAIPVRVNERFPGETIPRGTLDGTAYMVRAVYAWPDEAHQVDLQYDHEAIAWLLAHVQGTPVIAEAPLGFYREGGLRVSSYTGFPTLLGAHEREQRPEDQVDPRQRDAEALYTAPDASECLDILSRYHVRYVYVGQLERSQYAGPGLAKFDALVSQGLLARAYENPRVVIYEVLPHQGA